MEYTKWPPLPPPPATITRKRVGCEYTTCGRNVAVESTPFDVSSIKNQETMEFRSTRSLPIVISLTFPRFYYQFSLPHLYSFLFKRLGECTVFELGSARAKTETAVSRP